MRLRHLLSLGVLLVSMLACSMGGEAISDAPATVTVETIDDEHVETALPAPNTDQANRAVDKFFNSFVDSDAPGAVVIILKDGKTLYKAAYGLANLEKHQSLTTDHVLHLGSVGKQFTSLGIMMLAQGGKLAYDDPVSKYIPELKHYGKDFTIRHLLHHTSGLTDYTDEIQDAMFERASQPTNDDLVAVLADMDGPSTPPGDVFEYSNPGYELLGTIIERVSGQKFADFMQTRIFGPLGMTHTFSLPNEKRRTDPLVAMSYTGSSNAPEAYPSDDLDGLYGSGSIYTTVGDMALYDEALYAGTLLPVSVLQDAFEPAQLNDNSSEPYGFGWELEESDGQSYVAHSGAWLGFNSDYVRLLDKHLSVIVLLNRDYDYPDDPRIALKVSQFYLKP